MAVCPPITVGTAGSILPLELSVRFDGWRDACSVVAVKLHERGSARASAKHARGCLHAPVRRSREAIAP